MIPGSANPLLLASAAAEDGAYAISRSLRFNSSDSAYLSRTPSVAGNRKTWTWAGWVKRSSSTSGNMQVLLAAGPDNDDFGLVFDTDDRLHMYEWDGSFAWQKKSDQVFRDFSAWYHIVAVLDTANATTEDRARLYVNGQRIVNWNANTNPSLDFATTEINDAQQHRIGQTTATVNRYLNGYLADIHFIDGQALDPSSFGEFDTNNVWQPKAYAGSYGTNGFHLPFSDNSTAAALGTDTSGAGNDWTPNNLSVEATSQLTPYLSGGTIYNDPFNPNWTWAANQRGYTQGSVNSVQVDFPVGERPVVNSSVVVVYGSYNNAATTVQCTITYTDATTSVGTNVSALSKWLEAETFTVASTKTISQIKIEWISGDASAYPNLGPITVDGVRLVNSGAGNDSLVDSPTNGDQTDTGAGGEVVGNYATLNPLHTTGINAGTGAAVLSNGNLEATSNTSAYKNNFGTIVFPAAGKYYFEVTVLSNNGTNNQTAGIAAIEGTTRKYLLDCFSTSSTSKRSLVDSSATSLSGSFNVGDVIGVAVDCDAGTAVIKHNNIDIDSGYTLASGVTYAPFFSGYNCGTSAFNFGQRAWVYSAPSNHKSLCTTNLPDPTIADGSTAMDVALWTGNGSTQTISGLNFESDLLWFKRRDSANSHILIDQVRGLSKQLISNATSAEGTDATGLTAVSSTGFTLGAGNLYGNFNASGGTFVAWTWDAGSSTVSNTDGSIPSQVRANPSAGFSVVTYTGNGTSGATVGHGLGVKPDFLIVKNRDQTVNWVCYHKNIGATKYLPLNLTNAETAWSGFLNNTEPSSSVVTLGNGTGPNGSGDDILIYAFTGVDGYSSFGSYTGNGSADGPFVYTGFRPRWVMVKRTDTTSQWSIWDTVRNTYNAAGTNLWADSSEVETTSTSYDADFMSNGFKMRNTNAARNASGGTYIYAAFSEVAFNFARGR